LLGAEPAFFEAKSNPDILRGRIFQALASR
jgi:hypothetical protein